MAETHPHPFDQLFAHFGTPTRLPNDRLFLSPLDSPRSGYVEVYHDPCPGLPEALKLQWYATPDDGGRANLDDYVEIWAVPQPDGRYLMTVLGMVRRSTCRDWVDVFNRLPVRALYCHSVAGDVAGIVGYAGRFGPAPWQILPKAA